MKKIREFGDPDELLEAEDLILLKLREAWPSTCPLPDGCHFASEDRLLVRTNYQSLVKHKGVLASHRLSGALFAGCKSFKSSPRLRTATAKVLGDADTLILVHNRDQVCDLVAWFQDVVFLVLHHDLRVHESERECTTPRITARLEHLEGNVPALRMDALCFELNALKNLFLLCPKVRSERLGIQFRPKQAGGTSCGTASGAERGPSIPGRSTSTASIERRMPISFRPTKALLRRCFKSNGKTAKLL